MGIFDKGSVSFRRFTVAGTKPRLFGDEHLERLAAFARPKVASADGVEWGWGAGTHPADTAFDHLKQVYTDHLLADLFRQQDKLPADRIKVYYETGLKALADANPSGHPTARQKREARESARDQVEGEARDGRWKKWTCYPVMWGLRRNDVYLGCTSLPTADKLLTLFPDTFAKNLTQAGLAGDLTPVTAGRIALKVNPKATHERLTSFITEQSDSDPAGPVWHADDSTPDWLGSEFLVWLWWMSERTDAVTGGDGTEIVFMFSGGVRFDCPYGTTGDTTTNATSGVRTPEARAALKVGKLPRRAALTLVRHNEQFAFKLRPETLEVNGLKLPPAPEDVTDPRERHIHRLNAIENAYEAIEQLLVAFLNRRLSPDWWQGEAAEVRRWATSSGGKRKAA